jgi:hypothetical protein
MRLILTFLFSSLLIGCASYEDQVSELSDRELCRQWMNTADMDWRENILDREIKLARNITCTEIYSPAMVADRKRAANILAERQAESKRLQQEEKRAAREASANRQNEDAANVPRLVRTRYETFYGRNNERKRRTLCEYSDGRIVEYSQSNCPLTM